MAGKTITVKNWAIIAQKDIDELPVSSGQPRLQQGGVGGASGGAWLGYAGARGSIGLRGICRTDRQNRTKKSKHIIKNQETSSETDEVSDCRQSNFEVAEGLGKQIRFPNGIRSRNSLPTRKTASFKAFKLMELVCLFLCLSKSKS